MRSICTFLGKDFQNDLDLVLDQHLPLLCKDVNGFVAMLLKTFKQRSIEKMKSSAYIPRQLRMAVEVAPINSNSGMFARMRSLMVKPLQVAMMSPPILAACKTSNNTVVKATVKKAIDQAFNSFCQEKNIPTSPTPATPAPTPATPATPPATPPPATAPAPATPTKGGKRKTRNHRKNRKTRKNNQ
jgi:hypothetical protein